MIYRFFRKSKARRSFEYATNLISLGILTPFPIAYSETFGFGLKESYYICKHLTYDFDFRTLIHNPKFDHREEIIKQFVDFTYKLHESNVNFLDHSPGNTLIVKNENKYLFYLVDLNRMRFEKMGFSERMKNFRRLWMSTRMVRIIANRYATLDNREPDEVYKTLLFYSRKFQKKKNRKKLRRRKKRNSKRG